MSQFFIQFDDTGKGRATGWAADWAFHVAAHSDYGHMAIGLEDYKAMTGRGHEYSFDLEKGIVKKKPLSILADKPSFAGDGKDRVTITWPVAKPLNVRINGIPLTNNPHEGGLILTWDQQQRLLIDVDDYEYIGQLTIEAT